MNNDEMKILKSINDNLARIADMLEWLNQNGVLVKIEEGSNEN